MSVSVDLEVYDLDMLVAVQDVPGESDAVLLRGVIFGLHACAQISVRVRGRVGVNGCA